MKTKLTLTVQKRIIDSAKKMAKERNISLSQLFEQIFGKADTEIIKTEPQKAAQRLLQHLQKSKRVKTLDDKILVKSHISKKYA